MRISLHPPKKSTCYMLKLREIVGKTPASGDTPRDAFIMQDIGTVKPATIVARYAKRGLHVLQMYPIPDWEGETQ